MPYLKETQIQRLSNILDNAGQIFLGSIILPAVINKSINYMFAFGILATSLSWWISLELEENTK